MERRISGQAVMAESNKPQEVMFGFGQTGKEKEKVKTISLDDLSHTIRVLDRRQNTFPTRPVQSWELMRRYIEIIEANNVNYEIDKIYVQNSSSYVRLTDTEKDLYSKDNAPITRWEFDAMVSRIEFPTLAKDGTTPSMAISFHDKGISTAFGLNVEICSNMSILGGQKLHTYKYGDFEKLQFIAMKELVNNWIQDLPKMTERELEMKERMENTIIPGHDTFEKIIGKLYIAAVDQAYVSKAIAPFTINSMSNFTREAMKHEMENNPSVWQIYNWGTEIMKPGIIDIKSVYDDPYSFADFLINEFNLN